MLKKILAFLIVGIFLFCGCSIKATDNNTKQKHSKEFRDLMSVAVKKLHDGEYSDSAKLFNKVMKHKDCDPNCQILSFYSLGIIKHSFYNDNLGAVADYDRALEILASEKKGKSSAVADSDQDAMYYEVLYRRGKANNGYFFEQGSKVLNSSDLSKAVAQDIVDGVKKGNKDLIDAKQYFFSAGSMDQYQEILKLIEAGDQVIIHLKNHMNK